MLSKGKHLEITQLRAMLGDMFCRSWPSRCVRTAGAADSGLTGPSLVDWFARHAAWRQGVDRHVVQAAQGSGPGEPTAGAGFCCC